MRSTSQNRVQLNYNSTTLQTHNLQRCTYNYILTLLYKSCLVVIFCSTTDHEDNIMRRVCVCVLCGFSVRIKPRLLDNYNHFTLTLSPRWTKDGTVSKTIFFPSFLFFQEAKKKQKISSRLPLILLAAHLLFHLCFFFILCSFYVKLFNCPSWRRWFQLLHQLKTVCYKKEKGLTQNRAVPLPGCFLTRPLIIHVVAPTEVGVQVLLHKFLILIQP